VNGKIHGQRRGAPPLFPLFPSFLEGEGTYATRPLPRTRMWGAPLAKRRERREQAVMPLRRRAVFPFPSGPPPEGNEGNKGGLAMMLSLRCTEPQVHLDAASWQIALPTGRPRGTVKFLAV